MEPSLLDVLISLLQALVLLLLASAVHIAVVRRKTDDSPVDEQAEEPTPRRPTIVT